VYVSGRCCVNSSTFNYDYATIKYSAVGLPLWTNLFNGSGNSYDGANSLVLDSGGNVYVTGQSTGSGSGHDYGTIKYATTGVPLWTNLFNGSGNGDDSGVSLAVDGSGNVYVTGYATGSGYDYATIKYSGPPSPPFITNQLLSGGDMSFSFVGIAGTNYALDRTFNLLPVINWIPQLTNPAGADGALVFTNTPDPTTNNFWRIRSVP
jgi:hypothetical protein